MLSDELSTQNSEKQLDSNIHYRIYVLTNDWLSNYMRSEAFAKMKINIELSELNEKMNVSQITSKDERITNAMDKRMKMDKAEIKNTKTECDEFLKLAPKNYTCALQTDTYGSLIFPIISLWSSLKSNAIVNARSVTVNLSISVDQSYANITSIMVFSLYITFLYCYFFADFINEKKLLSLSAASMLRRCRHH